MTPEPDPAPVGEDTSIVTVLIVATCAIALTSVVVSGFVIVTVPACCCATVPGAEFDATTAPVAPPTSAPTSAPTASPARRPLGRWLGSDRSDSAGEDAGVCTPDCAGQAPEGGWNSGCCP